MANWSLSKFSVVLNIFEIFGPSVGALKFVIQRFVLTGSDIHRVCSISLVLPDIQGTLEGKFNLPGGGI